MCVGGRGLVYCGGIFIPVYPTFSQIEGLFEDINFSTKVTRDTLEEICADLFERVKNPVRDVLRTTEITMVRAQLRNHSLVPVTLLHAHYTYFDALTSELGGTSRQLTEVLQHIAVVLRHMAAVLRYMAAVLRYMAVVLRYMAVVLRHMAVVLQQIQCATLHTPTCIN